MNAATIMCVVCGAVAGLNIAPHGSMSTTAVARQAGNPRGWFIHALAATTKKADATPAIDDRHAGEQV